MSNYLRVDKTLEIQEIISTFKKINNLAPDEELNRFHETHTLTEINSVRMKFFKEINKDKHFTQLIHNLCKKEIQELASGNLAIQKNINLSIQMPLDKASVLPAHSDSWAGDSPYQINVWIPLTDTEKSNSMFIVDRRNSILWHREICKTGNMDIINNERIYEFINAKAGEVILFNGNYFHGNIINKTDRTRFSINFRAKNMIAPEYRRSFPDRSTPCYYVGEMNNDEGNKGYNCFDKAFSDEYIRLYND